MNIDSKDYVHTRERIHELLADPDLRQIHRRGNRRRLGRRAAIGAASVAVVAMAAVLVTQVATPPVTVRPATSKSTPAPVHGPLHGPQVSLSEKSQLIASQPVDNQRSYALIKTAAGKYAVARTLDGGGSWQAWQLPGQYEQAPMFDAGSAGSLEISPAGPPLTSLDGGQTWRTSSTKKDGPAIEKLPDGWGAVALGGKLLGSDPTGSGGLRPLAHQPQFATRCMGVTEARDGSLWLECPGPGGAFVLQVSHDRGVSWQSTTMPALIETGGPGAGGCGQLIDSYDGRTGYAYGYTAVSGGRDSGVVVTHDGGRTWSRTPVKLPKLGYCPVLTVTGSLIAATGPTAAPALISTDGGQTFNEVAGLGPVLSVYRYPGSDDLVAKIAEGNWKTSPDGVHWTAAPVPPNATLH